MPKLPKGMYRRGRSFYGRLYQGGREVRRTLGEDYEAACRTMRAMRQQGREVPLHRTPIKNIVPRWLDTAIRNGRNTKGVLDATTRARKYLLPHLGELLLERVTQNDLREFRTRLERRGASVSLVHHVLTDVRCFFRWCESSGLVQRALVPKRWLPKLPERPPDRLTEAEIEAVSSVPDPHGFVVRLALSTGLRWGELARLEATDIWDGVLLVKRSKNGKVRRVPMSGAIQAELRGRVGRLVPFQDAKTVAALVRRASGVCRFHLHQTRHTFACRYLERGGSLHALQQLLGHSSVLVTQRYARLSDEAMFAEHRRLEAANPDVLGTNRHTNRHSEHLMVGRKARQVAEET